MVVVALAVPFVYVATAYARPAVLSGEAIESIPNRVDATYGEQMRLLGYELERDEFRPAEFVYVTLYWQGLAQMDRDYSVSLFLLTPSGDLLGQEDSYPGLGSYPTSEWKSGDSVADRTWVRVRPRAKVPTIGWLGVSVYHLPTMEYLPATQDGQAAEQVFLQPVKVGPWEPHDYQMSRQVSFNLGNQIDLVGFDLEAWGARPGDTVPLTLYWRAQNVPEEDYTVFTHLVDAQGQIWAQDDDYPVGGDYPTSFWGVGEVVQDAYQLVLPCEVPVGEYEVEVGLYLASTGTRLPVLDDEGHVLDNRVVLGRVVVSE
jgi:hypothetical protein